MKTDTLELLIADCFEYINDTDSQAGNYWVKQLFTKQGDIKPHMITESVLQRLESVIADQYSYQGVN